MKIFRSILCNLKLAKWEPTFATELKTELVVVAVLENEFFARNK